MRIFIYTKDIAKLTGFSISKSRRLYRTILDSLAKNRTQGLTINEFSSYMNISIEDIKKEIK